ncbi:(2Fe-2S)-binding protein [Caloramator sp. mosi_1]|uniref:(2Fe-2S)-binding protein n=1 Tax=Caloramator sp. mosi_1 TaxID=3023090 RepID=UPI00235E6C0B|nr:(2Fe-2S)-binding protein [Caloramator sp. mosi_1]WDC84563.1 (2Fe-2S)-binding protein [Caloramator sp. mosi_1]
MNNDLNNSILDKLTKVCVCKSISRLNIKKAIENGAKTLDDVIKVTGATTGPCKGRRCKDKIEKLIEEYNESLGEQNEQDNRIS